MKINSSYKDSIGIRANSENLSKMQIIVVAVSKRFKSTDSVEMLYYECFVEILLLRFI